MNHDVNRALTGPQLIAEPIDWEVGDRVERPENVYTHGRDRLLKGVVTEIEATDGETELVYSVLWDGRDEPYRGYFWWGLRPEGWCS